MSRRAPVRWTGGESAPPGKANRDSDFALAGTRKAAEDRGTRCCFLVFILEAWIVQTSPSISGHSAPATSDTRQAVSTTNRRARPPVLSLVFREDLANPVV